MHVVICGSNTPYGKIKIYSPKPISFLDLIDIKNAALKKKKMRKWFTYKKQRYKVEPCHQGLLTQAEKDEINAALQKTWDQRMIREAQKEKQEVLTKTKKFIASTKKQIAIFEKMNKKTFVQLKLPF